MMASLMHNYFCLDFLHVHCLDFSRGHQRLAEHRLYWPRWPICEKVYRKRKHFCMFCHVGARARQGQAETSRNLFLGPVQWISSPASLIIILGQHSRRAAFFIFSLCTIGGPVVVVVNVDYYEFQPDQANFHLLFLLILSRLLRRRTA